MLKALEPFPEFSKKQKVNVNIAENLIIRLKNVANANLLVNNKKAEINHVVNNIIASSKHILRYYERFRQDIG
jgi:hypothetical protein